MIKFKIKEVFWIRKTAELPGPLPVLCPRPTGGSQHLLLRHPTVFLKPLWPNFVWIRHCFCIKFYPKSFLKYHLKDSLLAFIKKRRTINWKKGLHMGTFCSHTSSLDEPLMNLFGKDPFKMRTFMKKYTFLLAPFLQF